MSFHVRPLVAGGADDRQPPGVLPAVVFFLHTSRRRQPIWVD
jgi:hypothetical protein